MGRKKRAASMVWCYYCDRDFEDEKILLQHQKAKHFKCHVCLKKLSTAPGMSIHVLQVHKETVSKVPNAKAGRESTDIEIYGMQGIPPHLIAAHYGEEYADAPSKIAKVNVSSSQVGAVVPGSIGVQFPLGTRPPFYNPAAPLPPAGWPVSPHPQPWFAHHSAISTPPPGPLGLPQRPLFPVQNLTSPIPSIASPGIQPSFPNGPPGLHPSTPLVPVSQPLIPVVANNIIPNHCSSFSAPAFTTSISINPSPEINSSISSPTSNNQASSCHNPIFQDAVGTLGISHSYASRPNTDSPSIGPPPMISNKAPQPTINIVYLVWEDEAMSMEERRMSLKKY